MTPPDDSRDFKRIENPYITGVPVRGSQVFYGREDQFAYVKERLLTEREGIVLLFVGGRRSGKTSIMYQILDGRLGDQFLPVFLDMQFTGQPGDAGFLARLADSTIEAVHDERLVREYYDFDQGNPIVVFDRLLGDAKQIFPDRRMVFLVDEAEILHGKLESGEISGAVLTYMASILENRQVSFFFTGSRGLGEVTGEAWQRLLAKGDYRNISFLSRQDTARLVEEPVAGSVSYGPGVVESICELTNGQPFYTQLICSNVVDHLNGVQENALTAAGLEEVVGTIVNNPPPQLVYEWEEFSQQECIVLSLLSEVSEGPSDPAGPSELLQAVEENNYPLDLKEDALHITLEAMYERNVLERTEEGTFHFLVDLLRRWIRRNRSIWRLLEETTPEKTRTALWAGAAAAAIVVLVALGVWLGSGEEVPSAMEALPLPATTGMLFVDEYPTGSRILVDGEQQNVPRTPTIIDDLKEGQHQVVIQHEDYYDLSMPVAIVAGEVDTADGMLQRRKGYLTLTTEPNGAELAIQGETSQVRESPVDSLELPTGEYRIAVTMSGFRAETRPVVVRDLAETRLKITLPRDVGEVQVSSTPPGVMVLVDGEGTGYRTPKLLTELTTGAHDLRLVMAERQDKDTTVIVRFGETAAVALTLDFKQAVVELTTTPSGADIYLNDADTVWDQTPVVGRGLVPAVYQFRFVLDGYHKESIREVLTPAQQLSRNVKLEPYTGQLRLVGWGSVRVINETTGQEQREEAPGTFPRPVGSYRIVGPTEEQKVHVYRDSTIRVPVR